MAIHVMNGKYPYKGVSPERTYFNACCAGGTVVGEPMFGTSFLGEPVTTMLVSENAYMPNPGSRKPVHIHQQVPVITVGKCALKARELKPGDVVQFFGEMLTYKVNGFMGFDKTPECLKYMLKRNFKRNDDNLPQNSIILYAYSFNRLEEEPEDDWGANKAFISACCTHKPVTLRLLRWLSEMTKIIPDYAIPDEVTNDEGRSMFHKVSHDEINFYPEKIWLGGRVWRPDYWKEDTAKAFSKLKITQEGRPRVNILANDMPQPGGEFNGMFFAGNEDIEQTKARTHAINLRLNSFASDSALLCMRDSSLFRSGFNVIYVLDELAEQMREQSEQFLEHPYFYAELRYFYALADKKYYRRGPIAIAVVSSLHYGENFEHRIGV